MYKRLQTTGFWGREYEELRREYEELRRVFNPQKGITDVISMPIVTIKENTDHPTTKPPRIIKPLLLASTNEGQIVLDPFAGSGTTCGVAELMGRRYIGIEISEEYCEIARKRVQEAKDSMGLFPEG
jgi:site-specific DNA-methyltransferase (adenine-specific)